MYIQIKIRLQNAVSNQVLHYLPLIQQFLETSEGNRLFKSKEKCDGEFKLHNNLFITLLLGSIV